MNAFDQQYIDRNARRFAAVAHTEPGDPDIFDVIAQYLEYLDTAAVDCAESVRWAITPMIGERMRAAASTYAEVAAELRNALGMDTLTESKTQA